MKNTKNQTRRRRWRHGLLTVVLAVSMLFSPGFMEAAAGREWLSPAMQDILEEAGSCFSLTVSAAGATKTTQNKGSGSGVSSKELSTKDAKLSVTMLDVGQGLSVLVESDGHYLLYDGGGRNSSSFVVSYLKSHGITELDYIISSHYDEDHLSGLVGVVKTTKVKKALTADYTHDSKIYRSFKKAIAEAEIPEKHPTAGATYSFGKAKIQVVGPVSYGEDESNDNSLAVRIVTGNSSVLLTGDAEEKEETAIEESAEKRASSSKYSTKAKARWMKGHDADAEALLVSDIYIAGHHGSATASSEGLLKAADPTYVFISCGLSNSYGHPQAETMERLEQLGCKMYRTDLQGTVQAVTDGKTWKVNVKPCSDYRSGSEETGNSGNAGSANGNSSDDSAGKQSGGTGTTAHPAQVTTCNPEEAKYVVNKNTKVFHAVDCSSVQDTKAKNRRYTKESRESLIEKGYKPCGRCKP